MAAKRCASTRPPQRHSNTSPQLMVAVGTGATVITSPSRMVGYMLPPWARKRTVRPPARASSSTVENPAVTALARRPDEGGPWERRPGVEDEHARAGRQALNPVARGRIVEGEVVASIAIHVADGDGPAGGPGGQGQLERSEERRVGKE